MATTCPNTNLKEWKSLAESKGEDMAYFLWDQYDGKVPLDIINTVSDLSSTSESLINANFQLKGTERTEASPQVLEKVKKVIEKMGVNMQELVDYAKDNPGVDVSPDSSTLGTA
jgi:hypothetical protein